MLGKLRKWTYVTILGRIDPSFAVVRPRWAGTSFLIVPDVLAKSELYATSIWSTARALSKGLRGTFHTRSMPCEFLEVKDSDITTIDNLEPLVVGIHAPCHRICSLCLLSSTPGTDSIRAESRATRISLFLRHEQSASKANTPRTIGDGCIEWHTQDCDIEEHILFLQASMVW